jgi:hydrogenase expression/formation protein HypE
MHDATEGGLVSALREMAEASGVGLRIDAEQIPMLAETTAICSVLGLDAFGLLASGSLIAAVAPADEQAAVAALTAEGIAASAIGEALPADAGVSLIDGGVRRPLPIFPHDELARWLAERRA